MKVTVTLDHIATAELTKIRSVWTLLTNETRERLVRDCHMAAVVVAKGHPVNVEISGDREGFEHDSFSLQQLREVVDQWQYVHPDTRSTLVAALVRTVAQ